MKVENSNKDSKSSCIKTQWILEFVLSECYVQTLPRVLKWSCSESADSLLPFLVVLPCNVNLLVQSASNCLILLQHRRRNSISIRRCSKATTSWAWKEGNWMLITHHWFRREFGMVVSTTSQVRTSKTGHLWSNTKLIFRKYWMKTEHRIIE